MLSPEVWNFKPPVHHTSVISASNDTCVKIKDIDKHYFNHSVTVVLPDTVLVPEDVNTALTADGVYYKASQLPINTFLDKQFIDSFVKEGQLWALSVGTHIDTDDCAAITPSGHLILNLLKETYQTLGLEGTQSKFSTERYVVQIDLKNANFIPGKKNYERVVKCLTDFVELQMDFLISWEPPCVTAKDKRLICPSSIAAYLSELGHEIASCSPRVSSSRQYGIRIPSPLGTDEAELLEWLGAVALGVDMNCETEEGQYLSQYTGPLEESRESQIAVIKYFGFFTSVQIDRFFRLFRSYIKKRNDLPWAAFHVQGFSDSPVSWGMEEHTFQSDGDNNYTLVLRPDDSLRLFKVTAFPKKMKFKLK